MKLKNKKTGEIREIKNILIDEMFNVNSLAELNAEWEDYEEPKEYWYYDTTKNGIEKITHLEDKEKDQEIGNYFETREEAERAVQKLKAVKRLKDKGFRFGRWQFLDDRSGIWVQGNLVPDMVDELDILFGGGE